ncbi:MAG: FAD-binding oxidoreductase [Verrucomicrobia bacterium]|nr:FAD-binding oxidoreductase [Verrucomicrobiota bacterium]
MSQYDSWNGHPRVAPPAQVQHPAWRDDVRLAPADPPTLAYGNGRTYGDVCLNPGGRLVHTRALRRILDFDREGGRVTAECGVTFAELLDLLVPAGWFPAVTPGTSHLTLGGAVANDVHGKDHLFTGTIGRYLDAFELVRSDRPGPIRCTPEENADLFAATIGGLGLTGIITQVTLRLQRIASPTIEARERRCDCLAAFEEPPDPAFPHRIAWLDCSAPAAALGRGIFSEGRFAPAGAPVRPRRGGALPGIPLPSGWLGPRVFELLNQLRFAAPAPESDYTDLDAFFYPLDAIDRWPRAYGGKGFLQHQSLIPAAAGGEPVRELLRVTQAHGQASFVTVLKQYGSLPSPGLISFCGAGYSLAMDFAHLGDSTLRMFDALDAVVLRHGGRMYAAKDARMAPATFFAGYPRWAEFERFIDPVLSSGFLRRMRGTAGPVRSAANSE